jgi:uncharacterized protein (TIGR00297 family)
MVRVIIGFVLAAALAIAARHTRSLSAGGAAAATVVGTAAALAGWGWAAILIAFFIASSALSRYRHAARTARIGAIVEKGDQRDAYQVLANGGVFASAALVAAGTQDPAWSMVALGALAAATADTWATEIGTLAGRPPRSIVSLQPLPAGTSGGVTMAGTLASAAGAGMIAALAPVAGLPAGVWAAVFTGGVVGSLADSLAGATVQERRWCDRCSSSTERRVHDCGTGTRVIGGMPGARNDAVNLLCTLVGGIVAVLLAR